MGDGGGGSGAAALSLEDLMFPLVTLMLFRRSSLMERCNLFSFFLFTQLLSVWDSFQQ